MGVEPARRQSRREDGERSFERLYRRHRDDVYRALLRELGNREDAEDVTQTAFLDAYRALARGGRPLRPRAWLLTIAENARRRRFRAQRRGPEEASLEYEPAAREAEIAAGELREALEQLPPNQRAALVLREIGGFSYAEIAGRLELSVPAVQMLLFRARRALRAELAGEGMRLLRRLPVWPFPPWLADGFASPGVLPRAAGVVAAGAMGTAVVAGTTMIPGARPGAEPPPTRVQPSTVVSVFVRPQPVPARRASATRTHSRPVAAEPRPARRPVLPHPAPPRKSAPAPTPPAAHPTTAAASPPANAPRVPAPAPLVPIPELEPLAPPADQPPLTPVPVPDPVLPTLPPAPELPTAPLPETPVPAPPAGTGEPGGATIPVLRPS